MEGRASERGKDCKKYGKKNITIPPHDTFVWAMINGKLSALRWVMGDDWDMLDT